VGKKGLPLGPGSRRAESFALPASLLLSIFDEFTLKRCTSSAAATTIYLVGALSFACATVQSIANINPLDSRWWVEIIGIDSVSWVMNMNEHFFCTFRFACN
jgi:hypothetical protein